MTDHVMVLLDGPMMGHTTTIACHELLVPGRIFAGKWWNGEGNRTTVYVYRRSGFGSYTFVEERDMT